MPDAPDREPPQQPGPKDGPDRGDLIALGIGCLVVIIMFVAVVLVSMSDR